MSMITNLIEPCMGKLILNHLFGNTRPEFCNGVLDSYFFKLTLGSDCLFRESHFQNHPDSAILQKYQSLSNQNFKHISVHMPSLNLTSRSFLLNVGFVCSLLTVTTQKANACSPWIPCLFLHYSCCLSFLLFLISARNCMGYREF